MMPSNFVGVVEDAHPGTVQAGGERETDPLHGDGVAIAGQVNE
jgi:hypothetical protein